MLALSEVCYFVGETMSAIFPRSFSRSYPIAARSEGVYIFSEDGKRYLDASGGAAVVTIGHGVREVVDEMSRMAAQLSYAHSSLFHTRVGERLAELVARKFPDQTGTARVFFTSGGSEATETAVKLVRQYWLARGEPERYKTSRGGTAITGRPWAPWDSPDIGRRRDRQSVVRGGSRHVDRCDRLGHRAGSGYPSFFRQS